MGEKMVFHGQGIDGHVIDLSVTVDEVLPADVDSGSLVFVRDERGLSWPVAWGELDHAAA